MNATIETHWSRILYRDIFAAGAEMPHPSEISRGGANRHRERQPATRRATPSAAQRGGSGAGYARKER